ncbi:RT0821/Lpp0805 family surface protein [Rhizobium sp. Root708]|uniref:RT0821/Lpp0805 family surface protein n=1 Tax=Rhizobium sp. Root708 TaxID=1736592 RepID=UPI0009EB1423|nr:RT0821/Lpp0805 family surface protein [Rhizobium sp. Root708]
MYRKSISRCLTFFALSFPLLACSHAEPLETSAISATSSKAAPETDETIIAEAVGNAPTGISRLAWANPATGSAGVIEQINPKSSGVESCRRFVTSQQSLNSATRFDGVACPSDGSWKIASSSGLH